MLTIIKYFLYVVVVVGLIYVLQGVLDNSSSVRRNVQSSIVRISNTAKQLIDSAYHNIMSSADYKIDQAQKKSTATVHEIASAAFDTEQ